MARNVVRAARSIAPMFLLEKVICFWLLCGSFTATTAAETGGFFGGTFPTSSTSDTRTSSALREDREHTPQADSEPSRFASLGDGPRAKVVVSGERRYPTYKKSPYYKSKLETSSGTSLEERLSNSKTDLLVLGGGATVAVAVKLSSSNTLKKEKKKMTGRVTTFLQVGLHCDRSQRYNILDTVKNLGSKVDPASRLSLGRAVESICLELLRNEDNWISANLEVFQYEAQEYQACETEFNKLSLTERGKWNRDTFSNSISGKIVSKDTEEGYGLASSKTCAVLSLIVAWESFKLEGGQQVVSRASLKSALNGIGSAAVANKSNAILSVQVLWTPEQASDILLKEEIIQKWPTLIDML